MNVIERTIHGIGRQNKTNKENKTYTHRIRKTTTATNTPLKKRKKEAN